MMLWVLLIGGVVGISTVIMSYIELIPFLKALKQLNQRSESITDRLVYPVKFIGLLPLAWPTFVDLGLACACGFLGLNGGVLGCLIGLTISFAASCALKIHRHVIAPSWIERSNS